jgi:hypothetical protein
LGLSGLFGVRFRFPQDEIRRPLPLRRRVMRWPMGRECGSDALVSSYFITFV